jgi:hypothetical protein
VSWISFLRELQPWSDSSLLTEYYQKRFNQIVKEVHRALMQVDPCGRNFETSRADIIRFFPLFKECKLTIKDSDAFAAFIFRQKQSRLPVTLPTALGGAGADAGRNAYEPVLHFQSSLVTRSRICLGSPAFRWKSTEFL